MVLDFGSFLNTLKRENAAMLSFKKGFFFVRILSAQEIFLLCVKFEIMFDGNILAFGIL